MERQHSAAKGAGEDVSLCELLVLQLLQNGDVFPP